MATRRPAGFTLVEMLVALAVIVLMAAVGATMLRPPSDRVTLIASTRNLCSALHFARARAIASASEAVVTLDPVSRTYTVMDGQPAALPFGTTISVTFAASERPSPTGAAFRFFPSGSSSGGDIALALGAAHTTISLNWLTGEARCAE